MRSSYLDENSNSVMNQHKKEMSRNSFKKLDVNEFFKISIKRAVTRFKSIFEAGPAMLVTLTLL